MNIDLSIVNTAVEWMPTKFYRDKIQMELIAIVFALQLVFYKQPIYKQLALGLQIAKQRSGLNPFSESNGKN